MNFVVVLPTEANKTKVLTKFTSTVNLSYKLRQFTKKEAFEIFARC